MAGEGWVKVRLGELGTVVTGRTPPGTRAEHFGDYIPFVTPTDMDGRRSVGKPARFLSEDGARVLERVCVPRGVAVSCIGWQMGKALLIDRPCATNQQINTIVANEQLVDDLFLYYALSCRRDEIFNLGAGGSRTPILKKTAFERIEVHIPPLAEQRRIAGILGALDDKIELNRRMNRTLEAMARAIFTSWFVDFDPVRAKAAVRRAHPKWTNDQVSRAACPNLNPEIATLFPDSFQDSELGEIPKGWEVTSLSKVADFLNGLALQKYPAEDGPPWLPVLKIAQLRAESTDNDKRASAEIPPEYVVDDGDLIFSWSGSLIARFWCNGPAALNQHLFKVTSMDYPQWLYYHWLLEHLPGFQFIAASKATTMGHIQRHHLDEALVVVSPHELLKAMDEVFQPLLQKFIGSKIESRSLSALRDTLLPKLISGELRVPNAERRVEEVV